jgi:hypothetical protein
MILLPFALYSLYKVLFTTKNDFSQKTELKLFSRAFESRVIGSYITRRLEQRFDGLIFKQETEEV